MMRSLYSGVAGLKTHQTKMDVIGNNIANVNTVGFKSSSVNFADTFYQTVSSATGANPDLGTAGVNAKQIGLGSQVASITVNITEQGGMSTTNRALDVAINGEAFMVVRSGTDTLFTKSGAMNVDEAGNLYCTTNGATVQGWLADADGNIVKDTVKDLAIMNEKNMYYNPESTGAVTISGNIDPNDDDLIATFDATGKKPIDGGQVITYSFFDNIGEQYTVKFYITKAATQTAGTVTYDVRIGDILNSNSDSIFTVKSIDATTGQITYAASKAEVIMDGQTINGSMFDIDPLTGELKANDKLLTTQLVFSEQTGDFVSIGGTRKNAMYQGDAINLSIKGPVPIRQNDVIVDGTSSGANSSFPQWDKTNDTGGTNIYFNSLTQYSTGGTSKLSSIKGDSDGLNTGNKAGNMKGITIDNEGKVWGSYDNGLKKCLAQIAFATFANPSGLEAVGDSLFAASLNSGDFDGVGEEVSLSGSLTVGALEMSNVDLANEFTQMITTQRGFQANSRIITTTDSMLEELVNLKR